MTNYDFQILQYNELELLTRDLFQAEFNVYIESFRDGRDLGIDLRFGSTGDNKTVVQVKRYKEWKDLKQNLKQEVEKVQRLAPRRYMISTSVALSPENKAEIMQMFSPYIIDAGDIYGRDDLNNLIGKHNSIERKYYKLWLASVDILQAIANRGVVNRSKFELDQIREEIGIYVQNDSFRVAYDILKEQRYVIISGIPGIGKTTLARMLSYHLLAQGYEEFVYVAGDLYDATTLFQEGRRQVFFFDDFLGANVFEPSGKRFDKRLIAFIDAIRRAKDKVLILTTREYILSEAKSKYEVFKIRDIDIAKCTVDLSSYSRYVRANILYNHLAEANLPNIYVEQLLKNKQYLELIDHPNYNPRIIEAYIDRGLWKKDSIDQFMINFKQFFDRPMMVWEYAFEHLDVKARYALIVLTSMGADILLKDWYVAFFYFCKETYSELGLKCDEFEWKNILRVLEDCFIRSEKSDEGVVISHFNPSVRDFIIAYLQPYKDIHRMLIQSSFYVEQLYTMFTTESHRSTSQQAYILVEESLYSVVKDKFESMMKKPLLSCDISDDKTLSPRRECSRIEFYLGFWDHFSTLIELNPGLLERYIDPKEFNSFTIPHSTRAFFATLLDWSLISADLEEVVRGIMSLPMYIEDCYELLMMLSDLKMKHLIDRDFVSTIEEVVSYHIDGLSEISEVEEAEWFIDQICHLIPEGLLKYDLWEWLNEAEEGIKKCDEECDEEYDEEYDCDFDDFDERSEASIEEMMSGLRVK